MHFLVLSRTVYNRIGNDRLPINRISQELNCDNLYEGLEGQKHQHGSKMTATICCIFCDFPGSVCTLIQNCHMSQAYLKFDLCSIRNKYLCIVLFLTNRNDYSFIYSLQFLLIYRISDEWLA